MDAGVPMTDRSRPRPAGSGAIASRTRPKSSSLTKSYRPPRRVAKMFAGLRSRWIKPSAWASVRASQACRRRKIDAARLHRADGRDQSFEAQAGQVFHHVIERTVLGVPVVEDLHRVRVREPGRGPDLVFELLEPTRAAGRSVRISLMAQGRFNIRCSARWTSPIPPTPIGSPRRYWFNCLAAIARIRRVFTRWAP